MEIWGGVECTVARVRNKVHDQLKLNGHEARPNDLELIADLGISTIRYPVLWEKYFKSPENFFSLHDKRLEKLRDLNITPIAGLMHHGSGPFITDLSQPGFPELLADYAYTIAQRYPWIEYYNPINEPLTTARFSGLYGIWYPHHQSDKCFARIFLNEMKGIILSMQKIREINPNAKLIPSEDICKVHSTAALKKQADFENNRRWLTYDILTGKLNRKHPFWKYFIKHGIKPQELDFFERNICTPYICGFNYYVTSERYLDEKKYRYPRRYHGGNGKIDYADVEAVRVGKAEPVGFYGLLKESWERYKLPMALSEVHLGCTREEQLRWFNEAYNAALRLKNEGVDFRAITAWSILGSYDWNSLLQVQNKWYESGVYDLRSGVPRPTALAHLIKDIHLKGYSSHPLLETPGWWKRDIRILHNAPKTNKALEENQKNISPLLIIGANGSLGQAFARICTLRGIEHKLLSREQFDIASMASMENYLKDIKPWAIINAAGFTDIDKAETCPQECFRENTLGAVLLSQVCKSANIRFLTFSTDQVFNGKKKNPYVENDFTEPLNRYGESKKMAEEFVLKNNSDALIIRSSFFFNPWTRDDLLKVVLQTASMPGKQIFLPSDIIISPTYIPDLVNQTMDLLIDNESGIWHLSGPDEMSHFSFIQLALNIAEKSHKHIVPQPYEKLNFTAERPSYSVLKSSQGIVLPSIHASLNNYFTELKHTPLQQVI